MKDSIKVLAVLWLLGMIGTAASLLVTIPLILQQVPVAELPSIPVLVVAQLIQGGLLLLVLVAIGVACAGRVGLRSLIAEAMTKRPQSANDSPWKTRVWQWSVGLGVAVPVVVLLVDRALWPWLPGALKQTAEPSGVALLAGLLYGGITEELMLRWGVMSLVAFLLWKLFGRREGRPGRVVMVSAIAFSAVLFGLGHLPVTSLIAPLTPVVILRAVLLNGVAAAVFGWLFWQFHLEAAILAHMLFHVVSFVIAVGLSLFLGG